jgi:hypothetical protein
MQLILAIEPDRRQATQISTMVQAHLAAELVIAGSTARALKALGERVPDLILTPALLAPADETMLAERLRELGPAATHIQTVTIPILSEMGESGPDRSLLSGLRRERSGGATEAGCEPTVFINQVSAYLQRAAQERQTPAMFDAASNDAAPTAAAAEERGVEDPAPVPPSPLAEWLDLDQVMAAIADDPTSALPPASPPEPQDYLSSPPQRVNVVPQVPDPPPTAIPAPASSERRPSWEEPVDDEGAFFDPHQRAFPALLAKLNAIANAGDANR